LSEYILAKEDQVFGIRKGLQIVIAALTLLSLGIPARALAWEELTSARWSSVNPLYCRVQCSYDDQLRSVTAWANALYAWDNSGTPADFYEHPYYDVYFSDTTVSGVIWDGMYNISVSGSQILGASAYLNRYHTDSYGANKRQSVAGHEAGHILTLDEEPDPANVLMNPVTSTRYDTYGIYTPQSDDISGVNAMY
jgi:hypothetical protein